MSATLQEFSGKGSSPLRRLLITLSITLLAPSRGSAQIPILEGLFKNVSDVNLFGTLAWFADRAPALAGSVRNGEPKAGIVTGLGFEVSFEIGQFSPRKPAPKDTSEKPTRDTVEVQEKQPDGSVVIYKPLSPEKASDSDYRWLGELAIGYTELRDFESATPGLAIFGVVRELPSVSLYFSHQAAKKEAGKLTTKTDADKGLGWYLGVRTGLAELQGFRGYVGVPEDGTPDQIYNGGGTTFQFGVLAGATFDFGSWNLFLEPGYTRRRFSSVEWEGINGSIADVLPRSLDMSTWGVSLGTQIAIGSGSKK